MVGVDLYSSIDSVSSLAEQAEEQPCLAMSHQGRAKPDAQYETQPYGGAVRTILQSVFPVCLEKWDARSRHPARSAPGCRVLQARLAA